MRLEVHQGRSAALARLDEYQRAMKSAAALALAQRLRKAIEGRGQKQ